MSSTAKDTVQPNTITVVNPVVNLAMYPIVNRPKPTLLYLFEKVFSGQYRSLAARKLGPKILSLLDKTTLGDLPSVSAQFYRAVTQRRTLPSAVQAEAEVKGKHDNYVVRTHIDRKMAEEIFRQTGRRIEFPLGQEVLNDYYIGRGLGSGGVIRVCYARNQKRYFAIKITEDLSAQSEIAVHSALNQLRLPHILPAVDSETQNPPSGKLVFYQVLDLAGLGSAEKLRVHIQKVSDGRFREQLLFCLAEGLLRGLANMHTNGICHLDMKPNNLAVRQDGSVLLIDFGCAEKMVSGKIQARNTNGDTFYFSPDRWIGMNYAFPDICEGSKIDAWAAGLTLLELAQSQMDIFEDLGNYHSGSQLSKVQSQLGVFVRRQLAKIPELQPELLHPTTDSFWSLILSLLHMDVNQRLTPETACQHPWFKRMEGSSKDWRQDANRYLCELVQTLDREQAVQKKAQPTAHPKTRAEFEASGLSPQDLPFPHFASFVERKALQEALSKHLLESTVQEKSQLLVCQGMGGVGKTQLVTYLLHRPDIANHFGLRLWFRACDNPDMLALQCIVLARELGLVDDKAQIKEALEKLHTYLELYPKRFDKPWVAVFDNAGEAEALKPYLPPKCGKIIVTTRSTLWKETLSIDVMTEEEGQTLVYKLLQKTQQDEPKARDLCQALGYLPLGIVQACAYVRNQQIKNQRLFRAIIKSKRFGTRIRYSIIW